MTERLSVNKMYDVIEIEQDNEYEVVCAPDEIIRQINNQAQALKSAGKE